MLLKTSSDKCQSRSFYELQMWLIVMKVLVLLELKYIFSCPTIAFMNNE